MIKKSALVFLLLCLGCSNQHKSATVHITLVNNNHSVQFKGMDAAILGEMQRDSTPKVWQSLIPVYRMPADTDLKDYQPVQPGTYQIKDNAIIFTPDTPFIKGQKYFMRYYHYGEGKSVWDMIKNKRKLGSEPYTDLVFL